MLINFKVPRNGMRNPFQILGELDTHFNWCLLVMLETWPWRKFVNVSQCKRFFSIALEIEFCNNLQIKNLVSIVCVAIEGTLAQRGSILVVPIALWKNSMKFSWLFSHRHQFPLWMHRMAGNGWNKLAKLKQDGCSQTAPYSKVRQKVRLLGC